jgi:hypothetical protein
MKTLRLHFVLFVFAYFLLARPGLSAQQEQQTASESEVAVEGESKYKPRESYLLIDIPLTIAEDLVINLLGNGYWRLWGPDSEAAYFTLDSMRANLNPRVWDFEAGQGGDTFFVNQFLHPYAGAVYFASARSNNFNFYSSIFSSIFGSLSWEALGETDSPAASDLINTGGGGIVLGEILHRLYLELDKGGIAGKIGATVLSPPDRITAAIRGYGPEPGPSNIYDASLAFGFSWLNTRFSESGDEILSWNRPAAFFEIDLVYGDPYVHYGREAFAQFEFTMALTVSIPLIYNFTFISDGYLASWLLADDDVNQMSNGITLHFDDFITDKGGLMALNNGRENLSFNVNSLDYTIKWRRILSSSLEFSMKTHIGFSPWAVTDYNGGINKDDYYLYLIGGNFKLFLELQQMKEEGEDIKKGQSLSLSLCFYDTWNIPKTPGFDINTLFLFSNITYSFPFNDRFSLYAADSFLLLYCHLTRDAGPEFPDITRWYNSVQLGIKISF